MKRAVGIARVERVNRSGGVRRTKNCPRRAAIAAPNKKETGLFGKIQNFAATRQPLGRAVKLLAGVTLRANVS